MAKRGISKQMIAKIAIAAVLAALALFANFIAIRRGGRLAIEVDFYDKLSVAYDIGGREGLEKELLKLKTDTRRRGQQQAAEKFEAELDNIKDPGTFIKDAISDSIEAIFLLKNLRIAAFALILAIVTMRFFINKRAAGKKI